MIEDGLPGFNLVTWYAVYAPKGTPPDIVSKIRNTIALAATDPELIKRMDDLAVDLVASTPEELARYQRAEIERWAIFVRDAKITVD
jgi:tripartite-type tricarboxylate transporter receptor subunit TctC